MTNNEHPFRHFDVDLPKVSPETAERFRILFKDIDVTELGRLFVELRERDRELARLTKALADYEGSNEKKRAFAKGVLLTVNILAVERLREILDGKPTDGGDDVSRRP